MSNQPVFARGDDSDEVLRTGKKPNPDAHGVVPKFSIHRVPKEDGTIHEMEVLEKIVPGDLKSVARIKVTQKEINDFPDAYEAFKSGIGADVNGTKLDLWLGKDDPRIPDLLYKNIKTAEQLAELSDTHIQSLGLGYRELRDQAKLFVSRLTSNDAIAVQNQELKKEMEELRAAMAAMTANTVVKEKVEPEKVPGKLELKQGFQGKWSVVNGEKTEFTGKKAECEEWMKENG